MFPAISTIWIYWCPVTERSRLVSFALSGVHTGNAVVNLVAGVLCKNTLFGLTGWPFVYYIFGMTINLNLILMITSLSFIMSLLV